MRQPLVCPPDLGPPARRNVARGARYSRAVHGCSLHAGAIAMPSKAFTFIEHVILALLIAILARIALPTVSASLSKLRASREQTYVASMKTDLVQLVMAEEDYFRDSLKYTSA